MTSLFESAEELFEAAPCGYLQTDLDGTILRVNRTFEELTGLSREDLIDRRRFEELLAPGGRIYHETHYAPLLRMQGSVKEIAVEIVRADGTRLPALINSVVQRDPDGEGHRISTTVFDATDRRRYERELVASRERERSIARRLQESLLAGALPVAAGLDLGVGYQPAEAGLEVGGDWFDAFWLADGETVMLVVGDVVGRGIEAAATMGQLRSALRALASTGLEPGDLLSALDEYARRHGVGQMATIVCAQLHLPTGRLCFTCAGHPPPVILDPAAPPVLAWEGRATPLDAFRFEHVRRPTAQVVLPPGGAVLLYTDGLVERRAEPLDVGLGRLLDAAAATRDKDARTTVDAIGRALREDGASDDVCLLLARVHPA